MKYVPTVNGLSDEKYICYTIVLCTRSLHNDHLHALVSKSFDFLNENLHFYSYLLEDVCMSGDRGKPKTAGLYYSAHLNFKIKVLVLINYTKQ